MNKEPALIIGGVIGVLEALLALVVAFGLDLNAEQIATILGFANALGAVMAAVLIRNSVFSPATVREDFMLKDEFAEAHKLPVRIQQP